MLTGNEPISAGNLKAVLGAGRTLSITSGSAHAHDEGNGTMSGTLAHTLLGGSPEFKASGGVLTCETPGYYSICVYASASVIEKPDSSDAKTVLSMRISRSGAPIDIPIVTAYAPNDTNRFPNVTETVSFGYKASLEKGDTIEFRYEYTKSSTSGGLLTECEAHAGYYIERTG